MRKRIWITCAVISAICIWLLLRETAEKSIPQPVQSGTPTKQSSQSKQKKTAKNTEARNPSGIAAVPPIPVTAAAISGESNIIDSQLLANWQALIDFYGKVVDENTNPVAGVNIKFRWSELPTEDGMRTTETQSDSKGLFSLQGKRGRSLTVWFSKEDYYASHKGQIGFNYALGPDIISPDPQNPVIFNLRKKGTPEPLVSLKRNYRLPRDGTPLSIDLFSGASTTGENGNLVVRCWTKDQGKQSGEKYDWRCVISIPGGGIAPANEEFAFLAPEKDYTSSAEITMPTDRPDWKSDVDLKFFYRLADGRYGRMKFSMIAGGQHFCMIDSVLNPAGSRNLEPSN
jgi:hypothetical protein